MCKDYCRSALAYSTRYWDDLLARLTTRYHGRYGFVGSLDLESPIGDPKDRARLATIDGHRFLFARDESGGWLKFSSGRNMQGEEIFGGEFEAVADAPPCELRTAQQRQIIEGYQES